LREKREPRVEAEEVKARIAEKKAKAKEKEPCAEAEALITLRLLQKAQMEACMIEWEL